MLPLASSAVPLAGVLIIGGGIVTLVAAVATVASFTPTYKGLGWDGKAQMVGGLLAVPGLAAVFAGSALQLTSNSAALTKVETVGAAIVSASVVVAFALPIANRGRGKLAAMRQRRREVGASLRQPPP